MQIKTIRKAKNLAGKKVLLLADFDVAIKDGRVIDDYKIRANLLTLIFLIRQKCKIILISHLKDKQSLEPVAIYLNKIFSEHPDFINLLPAPNDIYLPQSRGIAKENIKDSYVRFLPEALGFETREAINKMKNGDIVMFESLSFGKKDLENNNKFAKDLASLADIYVNNAFSLSREKLASNNAIKNYLPSYAGLLLEREVASLNKIKNPKKPFVVVIGGNQNETKLPLILKLYESADQILLGGAVANTFLKMLNFEIGKSQIGKTRAENVALAKKKISQAQKRKILSPLDFVVEAKGKNGKPQTKVKGVKEIGKKDKIIDIGPQTVILYSGIIRQAKTIVWSGPLGKFEQKEASRGTMAIARSIAARSSGSAFGAAIGECTSLALEMTGMRDYMDWVSSEKKTSLAFLRGEELPGLHGMTG